MSQSLKRLLPWALSLAIVGYLFWTVDREAFLSALKAADMLAALGWIGLFTVGVFFVDSLTLRLLLVRLVAPMRYSEVLAVKGVSYFLNAITYTAGAGGIAYFVHRKKQVPLLRALSSLVWLNFVDVMALLTLLMGGLIFARDRLPDPVLAEQITWVVGAGLVVAVGALVYWRVGVDFFVLGPFRSWRIFQCFRDATWADYGVLLLARTSFIGLYVVMAWVLLPTFHIHVDMGGLLVYVPLLTFVQTIPASVSGLGAVQGVMQLLYAPYVDPSIAPSPVHADAMVLAFSTVVGPVTSLTRIAMGYLFMNDVTRDLLGDMDEALAEVEVEDGPDPGAEAETEAVTEPGVASAAAVEPRLEAPPQREEKREAGSVKATASMTRTAVSASGGSLVQPLTRLLIRPLHVLVSPVPQGTRERPQRWRPLRVPRPLRALRKR